MISNIQQLSLIVLIIIGACTFTLSEPKVSYAASENQQISESESIKSLPSITKLFKSIADSTGIAGFIHSNSESWTHGFGRVLMIMVGLLLLYLGIAKGFEPLLLE